MIIAKAVSLDVDRIMEIVNDAKTYLKSQGVNQWQDGYPNAESFNEDIRNDRLYVVRDNDLVVGVFALVTYEPTYDVVYDGSWSSDGDYVAVHRIAVASDRKGKGVARFIFDELKKEYPCIRVDTHRQNASMNKCLLNNGFKCCGIIHLARDSESDIIRLAYEYIKRND